MYLLWLCDLGRYQNVLALSARLSDKSSGFRHPFLRVTQYEQKNTTPEKEAIACDRNETGAHTPP